MSDRYELAAVKPNLGRKANVSMGLEVAGGSQHDVILIEFEGTRITLRGESLTDLQTVSIVNDENDHREGTVYEMWPELMAAVDPRERKS
jgi:hypothetical protein